jgi:hypothetical protein
MHKDYDLGRDKTNDTNSEFLSVRQMEVCGDKQSTWLYLDVRPTELIQALASVWVFCVPLVEGYAGQAFGVELLKAL